MQRVLERIKGPEDLEPLSLEELGVLASEIRELIIRTVARQGGHLSSNLGVVELTIALHRVFDSPKDKIIWDVGHQCYTHKILTGRREKFSTLRKKGGISGFPRREEEAHDAFNTGHSSTSISAGLGMACARDLKGESYRVVAVIGDGALTSGMAYEALNNAGSLKKDLIVVLNDNEMSVSFSVGALSMYLNRLRTNPEYNRLRQEVRHLVQLTPFLKREGMELIETMERRLKGLVLPGTFFEELGFRYFGVVDGHSLRDLIEILEGVRNLRGPILVHAVTKKGKGYRFSEENPCFYHSSPPFHLTTGRPKRREGISWSSVFGESLLKLADKNRNIVAVTAAMSEGTKLSEFREKFPERFFDTGIAESHAVTFAAGMALRGYKPVVAVYSTFLQRAYDQILHDVALQDIPIVLVLDRAGIVGADGPTHQGIFDIAYLRHLPNLILMVPCDARELQDMLYTALKTNHPVAIRYPKGPCPGQPGGKFRRLTIGKGQILREGKDVVIFALGSMVLPAEGACRNLAKKKVSPILVNPRFAKPLDEDLIVRLARKARKILTVEEGVLKGGFGSAVLELLQDRGVDDCRVKRLGLPEKFLEQGKREQLLSMYELSREGIVKAIDELMRD